MHVTRSEEGRDARGQKEQHAGQGRRGPGQGEGQAKEATGAVTGDKEKKAEGRSDQTKGTAKDKVGKAKDLLK